MRIGFWGYFKGSFKGSIRDLYIGALIMRIGFWGPYTIIKISNPPK